MKVGKADWIMHFDILKTILTSPFFLKKGILTNRRVSPLQTYYFGYVRGNLHHMSLKTRETVLLIYLKQFLEKYPELFEILCYLQLKDFGFKCVLKKNSRSKIHGVLYLVVFYLKVNWRNIYIESFTLQQCRKANALLIVVRTPHCYHHNNFNFLTKEYHV